MELTGRSLIGGKASEKRGREFRAVNPATGGKLEPAFHSASADEVEAAARLAQEAFAVTRNLPGSKKAEFLRAAAAEIDGALPALIEHATAETALPPPRIQGETARTTNQLRMFADLVEEGSWVQARIDHGDAERKPVPKTDLRSMYMAIGPVVVFGASNFPLAYSVAGGDTASAFAAGNPVIVKAHPAHPATSEVTAQAVARAVRNSGLPAGMFALLFDDGVEIGKRLVTHPQVKAVGFTGSLAGGRALMDLAAARPEPIPVYAEMGSVNPIFILPGAMRERREQIAAGLHSSVTTGAGQFCTKPGVVMLADDEHAKPFAARIGEMIAATPVSSLLTPGICATYRSGVTERSRKTHVVAEGPASGPGNSAGAVVFETDAATFSKNEALGTELFGPSTLLVRYNQPEELVAIAAKMHGHLTATVHATEEDLRNHADLIDVLRTKAGRIILNGYPTGVEVGNAMVHGGPYPATSDGRTTAVGTRALERFARLVCYQNFPESALPDELKEANPLGIWRMVDGKLTREAR